MGCLRLVCDAWHAACMHGCLYPARTACAWVHGVVYVGMSLPHARLHPPWVCFTQQGLARAVCQASRGWSVICCCMDGAGQGSTRRVLTSVQGVTRGKTSTRRGDEREVESRRRGQGKAETKAIASGAAAMRVRYQASLSPTWDGVNGVNRVQTTTRTTHHHHQQ
jgi:hypothetical protein